MTDLRSAMNDYLTVRRQLGFQLREPERLLDDYLSFCEHAGEQHLSTELAVRWARSVRASRFLCKCCGQVNSYSWCVNL
jgi:integrase/recombinase XerD